MIFGIGVDVLQSGRIAHTLERFGTRFIEHLLMPEEHAQVSRTQRRERFLAMRFAAKEAIVKAMGTGFAHGMWIRDVGVVQNARGKPEVIFSARGERVRRGLGIGEAHVTLTDEAGLGVAVAGLMRAAGTTLGSVLRPCRTSPWGGGSTASRGPRALPWGRASVHCAARGHAGS